MNLIPNRFFALLLCSAALFLSSSCSKDADLLSDYVISDKNDLESIALLANDTYYISNTQSSLILDVLNNDTFSSDTQVTIVSTSEPKNGLVIINEDNTLTYTPNFSATAEETISEEVQTPEEVETSEITPSSVNQTTVEQDSFDYTTEVVTEAGETFNEEARVTISPIDMGGLKAFPGAEGFGKYTTGGRGGIVIHVTNLNDSGSGSLRAALARKGPRTIVFDVGGDINLSSPLLVDDPSSADFTIAGQTAPSPGITIKGDELILSVGNVIMRYITIRSNPNDGTKNCIKTRNWGNGGYIMEYMIFDHLTLSHAGNENFGLYADNTSAPQRNITLQNSMLGKVNGDGNFLVGPNTHNISVLKNYFHHEQYRNPLVGYGYNNPLESKEVINNVVFMGRSAVEVARGNVVDVIANTYTSANGQSADQNIFNLTDSAYNPSNGFPLEGSRIGDGSYYWVGNEILATYSGGAVNYNQELLDANQGSRVVTNSTVTSWVNGRDAIAASVLPTVGNSLHRESLDLTLIEEYFTRTGDYNLPTIPNKTATSRPANYDTDYDGMADAWELTVFGDLSKSTNGDENGDGYTNLETFLFSLIQ